MMHISLRTLFRHMFFFWSLWSFCSASPITTTSVKPALLPHRTGQAQPLASMALVASPLEASHRNLEPPYARCGSFVNSCLGASHLPMKVRVKHVFVSGSGTPWALSAPSLALLPEAVGRLKRRMKGGGGIGLH